MTISTQLVSALASAFRPGDDTVLFVHSSFRRLGAHGCTPTALCQALVDWIGPGTVLMPAMSWRTITPAHPVFDERLTAGHTGILAETFRKEFSTHRSLHPTHSVSGRGRLATVLLSTHHQGTTPCGGNSPYGLARDYDGWILMIGVGLESCTAIHHCEEVMAPDVYLVPPDHAEAYTLVDRNGGHHGMKLRPHARLHRNFQKFRALLRQDGTVFTTTLFDTPCLLVKARALLSTVFAGLVEDRNATLIPHPTERNE